ncbi:cell division protein FtsQ/DivIB [Croceicoccus hydrothermalis]|uniref:cell division protein FtsQ/DivIB n=1 Tax=Croceicoccus hydrothermalis TaxID=2867964 RepID=UPI001EFAA0E4|nr:FtsQ-type POTRA domain-containing protein [Croceicoccus hydrothermalis]
MSTTIRRGGKGVRRAAAAKGKRKAVNTAKARSGGVADAIMRVLPISERGLQKFFQILIAAALAVAAWGLAVLLGVPDMIRTRVAEAADSAGFAVHRIEVRGVNRMDEQAIYAKALAARNVPMPLLDLDSLRADLVALPWVQDARVSRQLPDALVIDVVERKPHAVLRQGEEFVLIDPAGHRLEPVPRGKAEKMLVLSGEGAEDRAVDLAQLLDIAPALKPQVRGAEWIGNRRWNLTFATGQVLALPEGDEEARDALVTFARDDGTNRLLGGQVAVFDMRAPDRTYMRVPGRAKAQAELAAERARDADGG